MESGADLLVESRRLLNDLNDENAELKSMNHDLASQLREEQDAHQATKRQLAANEKDAKQINFNLMSQLKAKSQRVKELESQTEEQMTSEISRKRELSKAGNSLAEAKNDIAALKEHVRILEERNSQLHRQAEDSEASASKYSAELQRAISAHRDDQLTQQQEFNVSVVQLREEISSLKEKLRSSEQRADAAESKLANINEEHAAECKALVEEAKRNALVESEALYAHDQMHQVSTLVYQHLVDLQAKVRGCAVECEENDAQLQRIMGHTKEQQNALRAVHQCDAAVQRAVSEQRDQFETKVKDLLRELDAAKNAKSDAEGKVLTLRSAIDDIRRELEDLERQLHATSNETKELREANAALKAKLHHSERSAGDNYEQVNGLKLQLAEATSAAQMANDRLRTLEVELTKERGKFAAYQQEASHIEHELRTALRDEEEKSVNMARRCEEELLAMRSQVQEHTGILSLALGKLSGAASNGRSSSMHLYEPSHHHISTSIAHHRTSTSSSSAARSPSRPAPASPKPTPTSHHVALEDTESESVPKGSGRTNGDSLEQQLIAALRRLNA